MPLPAGVDADTLRFLERHEARVHSHPGREVRDLGDSIMLFDPLDREPFWNRVNAIRWPSDGGGFDRRLDEIVTLPDRQIFDAMLWVMERCKLVVEGAAAAPVGALLRGLIALPKGSRVAVVLSGGNLNLSQLRGLTWN